MGVRLLWHATVTAACTESGSGNGKQNTNGNQPLSEDHNHGNAALVCGTDTCSAGTGSAGRFGLESLQLQIEVCFF